MISGSVDLSIVIVSYNTRDILLTCLRSVYDNSKTVTFEVVVVDNDSCDGSAAAVNRSCPQAVVIENRNNRGFAKAVNQALAVSGGRHVLLLNSDTVVKDCALARMVAQLDEHPDIGAVGCQQWTEDGRLIRSCFSFPSLRDHLRHSVPFQTLAGGRQETATGRTIDFTVSQDVEWANGACLMIRKDLLDRLGGLDERFFMYFEDVDLCRRIHQQGSRVRYLAEAEIVHLVGRSSGRAVDRLNFEWELSRIRYIEKHFSPGQRVLMKLWIAAGTALRVLRLLGGHAASPHRRQLMQNHLTSLQRLWNSHEPPAQPVTMSHGRRD